MSKLAELLIVAIVPLLVTLYSAPLDLSADDEQSVEEALGADFEAQLHVPHAETGESES